MSLSSHSLRVKGRASRDFAALSGIECWALVLDLNRDSLIAATLRQWKTTSLPTRLLVIWKKWLVPRFYCPTVPGRGVRSSLVFLGGTMLRSAVSISECVF